MRENKSKTCDPKPPAIRLLSINRTKQTKERTMHTERIAQAETSLKSLFEMGSISVHGVTYLPVKLNVLSADYRSPSGKLFSAVWVHAKVAGSTTVDTFELIDRKSLNGKLFAVVNGEVRPMVEV
jgi:hypothetical protein